MNKKIKTEDSANPRYIQLKNLLKQRILSDPKLKKLPSTMELAQQYQVGKNTVLVTGQKFYPDKLKFELPGGSAYRFSWENGPDYVMPLSSGEQCKLTVDGNDFLRLTGLRRIDNDKYEAEL